MKRLAAALGLVVALGVGGVIVPAAAAPAQAGSTYCHNVRIAHTPDPNCYKLKPARICTYYTYKYICD